MDFTIKVPLLVKARPSSTGKTILVATMRKDDIEVAGNPCKITVQITRTPVNEDEFTACKQAKELAK